MRLIFLTKYTNKGPSSRYRSYQYLPLYYNYFNCKTFPFFNDSYIDKINNSIKINIFSYLFFIIKRIYIILFKIKKSDIIFIEYELIPYFPPIFEYYLHFKKIKYIVDYDDAIFHNYDNNSNILIRKVFKNKIPYIVKLASHIITGSPYLTQILVEYNNKISEIPTSIDIDLYNNKYVNKTVNNSNDIIIGWIGSKTTSVNLIYIREALIDLSKKFPNIQFHFCGFDKALMSEFTFKNCKFFEWTVENEFIFLNNVSIGIMPLENNLFNMGKCGFKLIQYMAMGKPTVSFPFPANLKINHNNGNLFARSPEEWYSILSHMITHFDNYKLVGEKNRKIVENEYSIQSNFQKYISIIKNL